MNDLNKLNCAPIMYPDGVDCVPFNGSDGPQEKDVQGSSTVSLPKSLFSRVDDCPYVDPRPVRRSFFSQSTSSSLCNERKVSSLENHLLCDYPQGTEWNLHEGESGSWVGYLSANFMIGGIRLKPGNCLTLMGDGLLESMYFSKSHLEDGLPIEFSVGFHPNGRRKWITSSQGAEISGYFFPKKSTFFFDENGNLERVILEDKANIDRIPCGPAQPIAIRRGRLIPTELMKNSDIPWGEVIFHNNGRLKTCTLSQDFSYEGDSFRKNSEIEFDRWGSLNRSAETIQGRPIPPGSVLGYLAHESHRDLATIVISHPITTLQITFPAGTTLANDAKHLRGALLAEKMEIQGIPFEKGDIIFFDENGRLSEADIDPLSGSESGWVFFPRKILGIPASHLSFYGNGQIESAVLSNDTEIEGKQFSQYSRRVFDDKGEMVRATFRVVEFDKFGKVISSNQTQDEGFQKSERGCNFSLR